MITLNEFDDINSDWIKTKENILSESEIHDSLYPKSSKGFVTIDDRIVFIGGPSGGSGGNTLADTPAPPEIIPNEVYVGLHGDWYYGYEGMARKPIAEVGLVPGPKTQFTHQENRRDSVYVATDPSLAMTYARLYSRPMLLQIDVNRLNKENFYYDPLDFGTLEKPKQLAYRGSIPSEAIIDVFEDTKDFVTIDDRVVFIGGPSAGGGGTSGESPSGITAATFKEDEFELGLEATREFQYDLQYPHGYGYTGAISMSGRGKIKQEVITELSEKSGVPEEEVNQMLRQWADTSNDTSLRALMIQRDAADLFGVSLSEYQKRNIEIATKNRDFAESIGMPLEKNIPITTSENQKSVLHAMYENTQNKLNAIGLPENLTLYRGITTEDFIGQSKELIHLASNPISSWTSDYDIALNFAAKERGETAGYVVSTTISKSRILSTPFTGFGCVPESEFVILSNPNQPDQVRIEQVSFENR